MLVFLVLLELMLKCLIPHAQKVICYYYHYKCLQWLAFLSNVTFIHRSILSFLAECMGQECSNIIFQLGVLILELITGQSSEQGGTDLIQWVQGSRLSSSINMMIDPDLGNNYDSRELKKLLVVARLCIKSKNNPKFPVPQVFRYLQKKLHISCD